VLLVEGLRLLDHWLNRRLVSVGDSGEGRVNFFFYFGFFEKEQYQRRLKKHVNN
jgi:hypothetical protein